MSAVDSKPASDGRIKTSHFFRLNAVETCRRRNEHAKGQLRIPSERDVRVGRYLPLLRSTHHALLPNPLDNPETSVGLVVLIVDALSFPWTARRSPRLVQTAPLPLHRF
jgi:hypothetical protein